MALKVGQKYVDMWQPNGEKTAFAHAGKYTSIAVPISCIVVQLSGHYGASVLK
ncbi:hypothetical protein PanWU01x14_359350, partial [Parasponia andersonii]